MSGSEGSEPTAQQLKLWTKQRSITRVNADRELAKLSSLLSDKDDLSAISVSKNKLSGYRNRLAQLDELLLPQWSDKILADQVEQSNEIELGLTNAVLSAEDFLDSQKAQAAMAGQASASKPGLPAISPKTSKLPTLTLDEFHGDTVKWQAFWDGFDAAVHSKPHLAAIEKFQYLKLYVKGDAARIVEGHPLTADAYDVVVQALKERYDNPEVCIFAHLDAMITMKPASGDVAEIQRVFDEYESHIRSLVVLGMTEDTFGRVFTPLMLSKVPKFVRIELYRRNGAEPWTLTNLRKYLKDEINARQLGAHTLIGGNEVQSSNRFKRQANQKGERATAASLVTSDQAKVWSNKKVKPKYPCAYCQKQGHFESACTKFTTLEARRNAVKGSCQLCLRKGHDSTTCRAYRTTCHNCGAERAHHRSLCPKTFEASTSAQKASHLNVFAQEYLPANSLVSKTSSSDRPNRGRPVMPTALVMVKGRKGEQTARVIFDTASTQTFARADLLKSIGATQIGVDYLGLAGVQAEIRKVEPYVCYEFVIIAADGSEISVTAHALKTISCPIDKPEIHVADYPILQHLQLADPIVDTVTEVALEIIIGLDHYYQFVGSEQIRLHGGLVVLGTKLGYVLTGCMHAEEQGASKSKSGSVLFAATQRSDHDLDAELERLWRLDDVGSKDLTESPEDEVARQKFLRSVEYDEDTQRYSVRWPWKMDSPDLPSNYGQAYGRLKSLLKRLDPDTKKRYDDVLQAQRAQGIIELAPREQSGPLVHYLPHQCVVRPDKATTKLRVVYDASSKASKQDLSLNECIYRGPVFLVNLCGLLLRFRLHAIALISDIEKAFLQVGLQEVDRDVTRFLWVNDTSKPPTLSNLVILRFARVLFGINASPYMLGGTIQVHMQRRNTPVAHLIVRDNYVDNVISGAASQAEAISFYKESKEAFMSASMNLREWYCNDSSVAASIPANDRGKGMTTTVLGLIWDTQEDVLSCSAKLAPTFACTTKRSMLKAVASIFDPLGFFTPITIRAKMLLQELWKLKLPWDAAVPAGAQATWDEIYPDLCTCGNILVPRRCAIACDAVVQLHCFNDASKSAYGSVIYLRSVLNGKVNVRMVFAKGKVCPIKNQTLQIPGLELTAIAMGTKLLRFVEDELHLGKLKLTAWTDSMCSYHWVVDDWDEKKDRRSVYVKNRVKEIKKEERIELRYVPTETNPADILTRGSTIEKLRNLAQWWHGPTWLSLPSDNWPKAPINRDDSGIAPGNDAPSQQVALPASARPADEQRLLDPQKFSRLARLLRVTAFVIRFTKTLTARQSRQTGPLNSDEIEYAFRFWVKETQTHFAACQPDEFAKCKRNLGLFVDPAGLMRCSGRLNNAEVSYEECYPAFLPKGAHFTKLLILDRHEKNAHAGTQHTLACIRRDMWVPKGRLEVKRVIGSCGVCRRSKGGPFRAPAPPPLPEFRVQEESPFSSVGIDYLGPLLIRQPRSRELVKVWMCLFSCCSTRAVHLEVVTDMTTDQFLLSLRRFGSLYGCPKLILCDNAKQFHTGHKVVEKLWAEAVDDPSVQAFCSQNGIRWKFIVEYAPWMGGVYERMVGVVKKALRCTLQRQLLHLTELQTICAEICATVNSRPLTYCDEEIGFRALTPNDLIVRNRPAFPAVDVDTADPDYVPRPGTQQSAVVLWKRLEKRLKTFWGMWHRDDLLSLRERSWGHNNRGGAPEVPTVGAVVLIHRDQMPRSTWLLGRIESYILIYSSDRTVRSARVRLADGTFLQRPVKLLYPIEVSDDASSTVPVPASAVSGSANGQACQAARPMWGLDSSASEDEC